MVDFMRGAGCGAGCVILDTIRAIFQEAFRVAKAIKALGDLDRWNGWNPPRKTRKWEIWTGKSFCIHFVFQFFLCFFVFTHLVIFVFLISLFLYSWSSTSYGCTLESCMFGFSPASSVKQERPGNKPFHNLSTEKAEAMIGRYTSYFDQHVVWFIVRLVWLSWMFGWQRYTHVNHHVVKKSCMLSDASVLN